jgi:uncharacterized membrane protein YfcA
MSPAEIGLIVLTFGAAIVNGALGYGFSSITVPVALLFLTSRVLNPALVLIEVVLNAYVLWVNRRALPTVWPRVSTVVAGLIPGVWVGTQILSTAHPDWLKFGTYVVLLPLIFTQVAGWRRPIQSERVAGLFFGTGVGVLYAATTISGPPLAVALNNQGLTKQDFRAALGVVRLAESSLTAAAYLYIGMFTPDSLGLIPYILPSILVGVPIGTALISRIHPDVFRRACMSFDAWIVAFGIATLLQRLSVAGSSAYLVLVAVMALDGWMLRGFLAKRRASAVPARDG